MSDSHSGVLSAHVSGTEAESASMHDNASAAGSIVAAHQPSQHPEDATQSRSNGARDLLHDITEEYGPQRVGPGSVDSDSSSATGDSSGRSTTSSMAVSVSNRSTAASSLASSKYPALSTASTKSGSSLRTSRADSIIGHGHYPLSLDEHGVPTLSERELEVRLECCFQFLGCFKAYDDVEEWDSHYRWHLAPGLPRKACCPFEGCVWTESATSDGDKSGVWDHRLEHMQQEHVGEDFVYKEDEKPNGAVLDHVQRNRRMKNLADYQELRRDGHKSQTAVVISERTRPSRRR